MSTQSAKWSFPGKVLIVDDQFNEEIKQTILSLANKGISVQYWDSKDGSFSNFTNIRVLILDLDLSGGVQQRGDKFFYTLPAQVLNKIHGPYMVIILSRDFIPEDITNLKSTYEEQYQKPIEGFVEGIEGLPKGSEVEKLHEIIKNLLQNSVVLKLILIWEKILDIAKDLGLSKFLKENFENEINAFIKSIGKDVGKDSLSREFITNMIRFISRYVHRGKEYQELMSILQSIYDNTITPPIANRLLQHRSMYFRPDPTEQIWTGDIFKIENSTNEKFWDYQIVLSPECNISQQNFDTFLICKGFPLTYTSLSEKEHPLYKISQNYSLPERGTISEEQYAAKIQKSFKSLPKRLHLLWNFSEKDDKYFGLCFDFQRVGSIAKEEYNKLKKYRICRLDFPFIHELVQKFANYNSRIGIPIVNEPHIDDADVQ